MPPDLLIGSHHFIFIVIAVREHVSRRVLPNGDRPSAETPVDVVQSANGASRWRRGQVGLPHARCDAKDVGYNAID